MPAKLTLKQQRFVEEYFKDFNATQAAIRAGYSVRNADKIGSELLGKTGVSCAIQEHMAAVSVRTGINAERILREYARLAFTDIRDIVTFGPKGVQVKDSGTLSADDAAAISEISEVTFKGKKTITVKLYPKQAALDMLAKRLGLMTGDEARRVAPALLGEFVKLIEQAEDDHANSISPVTESPAVDS